MTKHLLCLLMGGGGGGNYDFHLLLRALNEYNNGEVGCVMQSGEKVLYFSKFFLTREYVDGFTQTKVRKGIKFVC